MELERDAWKREFSLSGGAVPLEIAGSYALFSPQGSAGKRIPLLVCLHRYGGDPDRFTRIVPWLSLSGWAFAFLRGPFRILSEKDQVQFAWAVSTPKETDPRGRETSLAFVEGAVRRIGEAHSIDPAATFLLGHSQGGWLGLHALLRHPALFAGAVALGAQLNPELARTNLAGARGKEILLVHGDDDELIPADRAETARSILSEGQARVTMCRHPGVGHWPTRAMYAEAGDWLRSRRSNP